jgi:hypothetical protein
MATKITTRVLADNAVTDAKIADVTLTTATQSASDNTTKIATTAYVTTAIANLADSAPSTLNTLNELAAALGDDASFSTTVTNSIAAKLPLAGGELSGTLNITQASTADTIKLTRGTTSHNNMIKFRSAGADKWIVGQRNDSTDHFRFYSYGTSSDALSIQTDGDVLIGKSSSAFSVAGIALRGSVADFIRDGNTPINVNRLNSDGELIKFHTGGTLFGSIVNVGTVLKLKSNNNLHLEQNGNSVTRSLNLTGTAFKPFDSNNNQLDLGTTGARFKDGHFAGSLYAHSGNFVIATDSGGSYMGKSDNATLRLITNNTTRMTIRNDGGIGIGNNNAGYSSQILSVKSAGADNVFYGESTDTRCIMSVRDNSSSSNIGFGAVANAHVFFQDNTEIARFSTGSADKYPTSGNGGIGGTSGAGSNLHLHGDDSEIRMANQIIHADNSGLTKFTIRNAYGYHSTGAELSLDSGYISFNTGSSYTERMRIDSTGRVIIGQTSSPGNASVGLTVGGAGYRQWYMWNSGAYFYNGSNEANLSSGGAWNNASDERYKENIVDIPYGTAELLQLKPRKYNMKEGGEEQIGLIAQEVESIIPEVVEDSESGYKSMSYGNLNALLIKTIQELEARIATLEG